MAGLVGRKNVLAIMIQSFVSMGLDHRPFGTRTAIRSASAGIGNGVVGNLHNAFLRGICPQHTIADDTIPALVFIAYQMMFAIITPALISGAFTNRVTFKAYMLFSRGG